MTLCFITTTGEILEFASVVCKQYVFIFISLSLLVKDINIYVLNKQYENHTSILLEWSVNQCIWLFYLYTVFEFSKRIFTFFWLNKWKHYGRLPCIDYTNQEKWKTDLFRDNHYTKIENRWISSCLRECYLSLFFSFFQAYTIAIHVCYSVIDMLRLVMAFTHCLSKKIKMISSSSYPR